MYHYYYTKYLFCIQLDETVDVVYVVGPALQVNTTSPPPRSPHQIYVMKSHEPPWLYPAGLIAGIVLVC